MNAPEPQTPATGLYERPERLGRVLVTGAAGAIGGATVVALREAGAEVIGFDRQTPHPPDETIHLVDVSRSDDLSAAVAAGRALGPLSHLIVVTGGALPDEPGLTDDPGSVGVELFRDSLEHNLVNAFRTVTTCLPWLRDETGHDRSIVLTSSFNATSAQGMVGYSSAKAGLIGMMHAMVDPLGREGLRINVLAPGTVATPRTVRIWGDLPEHFEQRRRTAALGRLGEPEDVAEAYLALLRMRHATGMVMTVDGGQSVIHR